MFFKLLHDFIAFLTLHLAMHQAQTQALKFKFLQMNEHVFGGF